MVYIGDTQLIAFSMKGTFKVMFRYDDNDH
jgi:hypothetical protein